MRRMGLVKKSLSSKIYRVINDEEAKANGLIRVIDENGEDYAFSANRFYPIEVPKPVEEVLLSTC
jgi:hypothetical protein